MASKLEHALELAAQGFKIFPIKAGAKAPPLLNNWPALATGDEQQIHAWWHSDAQINIGIHCEGLLVIDVDAKKGGLETYDQLDELMDLPVTRMHRTPTGGLHMLYRLPEGHPGVPNSVETLGKGLDIRSTGGYIVAPGSTVEAGEYTVGFPGDIALAPAWLVERLGRVAPKAPAASVPDAPDLSVERARAYLAAQEPAIEGQGGDAHTFAVACGLRDQGVSRMQAYALLQDEWNGRCSPPWSLDDLWAKVVNAYTYAQNEDGGSRGVVEDDLPVPSDEPAPQAQPKKRTKVALADDLADRPPSNDYLVKHWLDRRSYAEIFGAPGEGKTFVAIDMAYHVAAGKEWMGHRVKGGLALYLAFEGKGGIEKRMRALKKKHGSLGKLYIASAAMNLREPAGRQELAALIGGLPEIPSLIVIDTLARALMGGDENSAQDVGAFNNAVEGLIDATGACVLLIHHSGKNKANGARGSSALNAAVETEIEIDGRQIISRKQRESEDPESIAFKLVPLDLYEDSDGDWVTSCVVEKGPKTAPGKKPLKDGTNNARAFDNLSLDNTPVDKHEWRRRCIDDGMPKQRFTDALKFLVKHGYVVEENETYRRMQ